MENAAAAHGRERGAGKPVPHADAPAAREWRAVVLLGSPDHGVPTPGRHGIREQETGESTRKPRSASCSRWRSRSPSPWTTCCTTRAPRRPAATDPRTRPRAAAAGSEQRGGLPLESGRPVPRRQRLPAKSHPARRLRPGPGRPGDAPLPRPRAPVRQERVLHRGGRNRVGLQCERAVQCRDHHPQAGGVRRAGSEGPLLGIARRTTLGRRRGEGLLLGPAPVARPRPGRAERRPAPRRNHSAPRRSSCSARSPSRSRLRWRTRRPIARSPS